MSDFSILEFPLTLIGALVLIAVAMLAGNMSAEKHRKLKTSGNVTKHDWLILLFDSRCASALLLIAAVLMAVEGTWSLEMFHSWPFLILVLLLMFCCSTVVFNFFHNNTCKPLSNAGSDNNNKSTSLSEDAQGIVPARNIGSEKHCKNASVSLNLQHHKESTNGFNGKSIVFVTLHAGFFLIICGGFFGAPDFSRLQMKADEAVPANVAYNSNGEPVLLPFNVTLEDFHIDYYKDGQKPKQFTSTLLVDGKRFETSVNHPCKYKGYRFYQADYDRMNCKYSILILVKDPWLPIVFIGMVLMALGSILKMKRLWNGKVLFVSAFVLAIAFGAISLARIQFSTLMPALRSLWFVPHLIFYMMSYSLLAISLLLILIHNVLRYFFCHRSVLNNSRSWLNKCFLSKYLFRNNENFRTDCYSQIYSAAMKCLETSSLLMLLGMLCGAVWARYAWGDYWTWDAKECWAAATWLLTLVAIHANHLLPSANAVAKKDNHFSEMSNKLEQCSINAASKGTFRRKPTVKAGILLLVILAAFIAMQITWYGVNYLPSAAHSLHTYNTKP